jgi:hypothetical protein
VAELRLSADALTRVHQKLEAFAESLPDDEQLALALVLTAPGGDDVTGFSQPQDQPQPRMPFQGVLTHTTDALALVGRVVQSQVEAANGVLRRA